MALTPDLPRNLRMRVQVQLGSPSEATGNPGCWLGGCSLDLSGAAPLIYFRRGSSALLG